jgi:hypothetical protein
VADVALNHTQHCEGKQSTLSVQVAVDETQTEPAPTATSHS